MEQKPNQIQIPQEVVSLIGTLNVENHYLKMSLQNMQQKVEVLEQELKKLQGVESLKEITPEQK